MPDFLPLGVSGEPCQIVELPVGSIINPDHVLTPYGSAGQVLTVNSARDGVKWDTNAADAAYDASGLFNVGEGLGSAKAFPAMSGGSGKILALSVDGTTLEWQKPVFAYNTTTNQVTFGSDILGDGVVGLNLSGATGDANFGGLSGTNLSALTVGDLTIHANAVVPSGIGATLHSDDQITCNADATIATHLVRWNQVSGNFTSSDHGTLQGLGDDDHSQYIFNAPNTTNRNLITQTNSGRPPFGIKKHAAGAVDLFEIQDSGSVVIANIDKNANLTVSGTILGATVSGTTVSGTAIEGQTVYAPSVSGVTVSGTTVKGINGSFSGDVSAASGANDGSLATMDMFSRMFAHTAYRSGSFSASQTIFFYLNTNDQDANFVIPAGMTLKILAAYGRCKSGGSAGTTTFTIKLRAWTDDAHSSYATYDLANGSTTSINSYFHFYDHGTMESPLASIVGSSNPVGEVGLTHAGPGTSGSDKHTVSVYGVFV